MSHSPLTAGIIGLGFTIGAFGICVHLAGDIITVSGIQPFLPFSRQRISLTNLRAASTLANTVPLSKIRLK
jgi:inner membrane protein